MDGIFGNKVGTSELAALRALLAAHAAVGVDFHVDDTPPCATVTLVWPAAEVSPEATSAPWVISDRVVGRAQFQALLRTLFLEGTATKALHRVSAVARWMATHGLANVMAAARHVVDLQLFYEHVVDPQTRTAPLPLILQAGSSTSAQEEASPNATMTTTQELYRTLLSQQLSSNAIKNKRSPGPSLAHTLLQHSVQRAHLCLVCLDRLLVKYTPNNGTADAATTKRELYALTQRRFVNASRSLPGHELVWFPKSDKYTPRSLALLGDDAHVNATVQRVKRHCDIEPLLALLPPSLYESIIAIERFEDRLVAISLDVGSKPKAYVAVGNTSSNETECVDLLNSKPVKVMTPPSKLFGAFRKKQPPSEEHYDHRDRRSGELSHDDLLSVLAMAGGEAAIDASNRVCVDRQLHRLAVVRSKSDRIVGLTMRVGRTVQFASNILLDLLHHPEHRTKSVLVVGGSGAGKTSLVRDIARRLSAGSERVCIVDTTNEIGGDGAIPHRSVDRATRFMVKSLDTTADAMVECVQNHLVDTLIVDEVTSSRDARALSFAKRHCRRRVIAGCAVRDLHSLVDDLELNCLIGGVQVVMKPPAGDHQANDQHDDFAVKNTSKKKPTQQTKQRERMTVPVVDVVVELKATHLGECRIVWDVPRAVDEVLAGRGYVCETRIQTPGVLGVQVEIN